MGRNQKSIMVDPETHEAISKFAQDANLSQGEILKSLCNIVKNRVNHAMKEGVIPKNPPIVKNPLSERYGKPISERSYYRLYVALHLKDLGFISDAEFDKNREDLESYIFIHGIDFIKEVDFNGIEDQK